MANVKVPALLHKMSKAAQKAWYKKNNMTMPSEVEGGGRSAAAAKRVVAPAPRKQMAAAPQSVRAMNTARQQAYYAKGGRQPIGAGGSGGSSSMAGVGQSSAKEIIKGIKAGYNPKVALVRYTNEEAEQVDEVTKKEAEETLGGPVKTKPKMPPGKQPEGYRYVRALARRAMKAGLKKEEVEQVDEAGYQVIGTTKDKETFRSKVHPKKAEALSTHYKMAKSRKYKDIKLVKVQEEAKQVDEARRMSAAEKLGRAFDSEQQRSALSRQRGLDLLKQKDTEKMQNKLASGNMTKLKKEETEESTMKYIEEKLTAADPASKWISDFVKSDNPKFAGKSKKERIQQALGAYYAKKRGTNEEVEQVDEGRLRRSMRGYAVLGGYGYGNKVRNQSAGERSREINVGLDDKQEKENARRAAEADKTKMKKEEVEQTDEAVERVDELKKFTLQSYAKKASKEMKKAHDYHQMRYGGRDGSDSEYMKKTYPAAVAKYDRRDAGVAKAKQKLAKEAAEGKVAVTPKEKSLAAHHGDKTKITFGDVLKARLKSAAAKKMGK